MDMVILIAAVAAGLAVYFLPAIIAGRRNHRNANAILALNLLLGWTFLGWVAALIWSLTANTAPPAPIDTSQTY